MFPGSFYFIMMACCYEEQIQKNLAVGELDKTIQSDGWTIIIMLLHAAIGVVWLVYEVDEAENLYCKQISLIQMQI